MIQWKDVFKASVQYYMLPFFLVARKDFIYSNMDRDAETNFSSYILTNTMISVSGKYILIISFSKLSPVLLVKN